MFIFLDLPVDKLDGLLQCVSAEDAEHWTEDLILVSLHTWAERDYCILNHLDQIYILWFMLVMIVGPTKLPWG